MDPEAGGTQPRAMTTPILPQWLATLILGAALIASAEIAFRLARHLLRRRPEVEPEKESAGVGIMLSGALALLGLLVGFTFAMASDRFDTRRVMINDEANAITTAYLRSRLAIGPDRAILPTLWANYGEARLALSYGRTVAAEEKHLERAGTIRREIWAATQREVAAGRDDITASLVDATNGAFEIARARQAAVVARIPAAIIWTLIIYALVASFLLGHALALDRRRFFMSSVLLGLVALSIALIIDLDRPGSGTVEVSQAPMEQALAEIRVLQAADRPGAP